MLAARRQAGIFAALGICVALSLPDFANGDETSAGLLVQYDEAVSARAWDQAEIAAKQLVENAIAEGRRDDPGTARLLARLADVQMEKGEYAAAAENYELAVEIVEDGLDKLAPALVEPLVGLGRAHAANRRPDLALPHYRQAVHIHQVNEGPHDIGQARALDLEFDALVALGDERGAESIAERLAWLYQRRAEEGASDASAGLVRHSAKFNELGLFAREREVLETAATDVLRADGPDSPRLVEPWVRIGSSYADEFFRDYYAATEEEQLPDRKLLSDAEAKLEEALEISRGVADWQTRSLALLAMGDFYTLTEESSRARRMYTRTWELLSEDPERLASRREALESPVPLLQPVPDPGPLIDGGEPRRPVGDYVAGHIVMSFTVNRRGRVGDVALVEISPDSDEAIEALVAAGVKRFVYRPRFERGLPADTPGETFRLEFPVPAAE